MMGAIRFWMVDDMLFRSEEDAVECVKKTHDYIPEESISRYVKVKYLVADETEVRDDR
ncbi:MAG: hypothetical protein IJF97_00695 [Eggerthellaceae bacterium]|nr:hypothetical protein [Eggerthellaceae bacterium]MBQ3342690.1 hypothetical protein [Kiritimatiellia bacterium]